MSAILFHTATETVSVSGSERAHLGSLCREFAAGIFNMLGWERQLALLPDDWGEDIRERGEFGIIPRVRDRFRLFVGSGDAKCFVDGPNVLDTTLNTVLRFGSDTMRLAARIHGQCELHGFVESSDAQFVADLIERGLDDGVFRRFLMLDGQPTDRKTGWEDVCRLLRQSASARQSSPVEPLASSRRAVVSSYTVCDFFPNQTAAGYDGGSDAWYAYSDDERWDMAMFAIRRSPMRLRWAQSDWQDYLFGEGLSALDLQHERRAMVNK